MYPWDEYTHRSCVCTRFPTLLDSPRFSASPPRYSSFSMDARVYGGTHRVNTDVRSAVYRWTQQRAPAGCRISQGRELFGPRFDLLLAGLARRGDFDERIRRVPALCASRRTAFRSARDAYLLRDTVSVRMLPTPVLTYWVVWNGFIFLKFSLFSFFFFSGKMVWEIGFFFDEWNFLGFCKGGFSRFLFIYLFFFLGFIVNLHIFISKYSI